MDNSDEQVHTSNVTIISSVVSSILVATLEMIHECMQAMPINSRKAAKHFLEQSSRISKHEKHWEDIENYNHS